MCRSLGLYLALYGHQHVGGGRVVPHASADVTVPLVLYVTQRTCRDRLVCVVQSTAALSHQLDCGLQQLCIVSCVYQLCLVWLRALTLIFIHFSLGQRGVGLGIRV